MMDIPKYIGLFLLKNQFCFLHGIGNLEMRRKPAVFDGNLIHPSTYEIFITPAGTIDDNLANFIANNEQITISKAAAALREFCAEAKADLHMGREVQIPYIGKIVEEYGRMMFIADADFQFAPQPLPATRSDVLPHTEKRPELKTPPATFEYEPESIASKEPIEERYEEHYHDRDNREVDVHDHERSEHSSRHHHNEPLPEEASGINWKKVIWTVLILISIVAGAIFGVRLLSTDNEYTQADRKMPTIVDSTLLKAKIDSINSAASLSDTNAVKLFRFIIESFPTRATAEKRAEQMKAYGHLVDVMEKDSTEYLIVLPVRCRPADTTQLIDSFGRNFNPAGVSIMY